MVPGTHITQLPYGVLSSSAIFAQLTCVTNMQTDRHTELATCYICSNRPHLCRHCGLIKNIQMNPAYSSIKNVDIFLSKDELNNSRK